MKVKEFMIHEIIGLSGIGLVAFLVNLKYNLDIVNAIGLLIFLMWSGYGMKYLIKSNDACRDNGE